MKSVLPSLLLVAAAATLGACDADRSMAPAAGTVPAASTPSRPTAAGQPAAPAKTPASPLQPGTPDMPPPGSGLAHYDGYGDMRFGMSEAEARKAWGGDLDGEAAASDDCHYLSPVWAKPPSDFAFMFEGGRFVRYDVGNDREIAPGGGRRGMTEAEIVATYAGRIAKTPHKYVSGGEYLRVVADDGSDGVLVFETDAAGKVTEWHAGVAPQVDYIEGCS